MKAQAKNLHLGMAIFFLTAKFTSRSAFHLLRIDTKYDWAKVPLYNGQYPCPPLAVSSTNTRAVQARLQILGHSFVSGWRKNRSGTGNRNRRNRTPQKNKKEKHRESLFWRNRLNREPEPLETSHRPQPNQTDPGHCRYHNFLVGVTAVQR